MNTRSKKKPNSFLRETESIKARYTDIFLKDQRVLFNCTMCNNGSIIIFEDFLKLIDHLIYEHTDLPIRVVQKPNLDLRRSFNNEIGAELCAAIFFTTQFRALFRCADCGKDFNELIPLVEHLLDRHYTGEAADGKRIGLSRLISKDFHKTDKIKTEEGEQVGEGEIKSRVQSGEDAASHKAAKSLHLEKNSLILIKEEDVSGSIPNEDVDKNYTKSEDGLYYACNFCDRRFPTRMKIRTHLISHRSERRYTCHICNSAFKDKLTCSQHVLRHIKEKSHQCTECSAKFHMPSELRRHMQRHKGERDFMCSECGRSFYTSGILSTHMRRHKNIRKYECDVCHKKFYDNFQLRHHKLGHSDERSHQCTKCTANFKRRKTLVAHMKLHSNKKEYKCDLCDSRFNQLPGLHSHMKTKHKIVNTSTPSVISDISAYT